MARPGVDWRAMGSLEFILARNAEELGLKEAG
jgi:hypothetical protein